MTVVMEGLGDMRGVGAATGAMKRTGQGPGAGPRSSGEGQVPEGREGSLARGLWADPEKMLFLFLNGNKIHTPQNSSF